MRLRTIQALVSISFLTNQKFGRRKLYTKTIYGRYFSLNNFIGRYINTCVLCLFLMSAFLFTLFCNSVRNVCVIALFDSIINDLGGCMLLVVAMFKITVMDEQRCGLFLFRSCHPRWRTLIQTLDNAAVQLLTHTCWRYLKAI